MAHAGQEGRLGARGSFGGVARAAQLGFDQLALGHIGHHRHAADDLAIPPVRRGGQQDIFDGAAGGDHADFVAAGLALHAPVAPGGDQRAVFGDDHVQQGLVLQVFERVAQHLAGGGVGIFAAQLGVVDDQALAHALHHLAGEVALGLQLGGALGDARLEHLVHLLHGVFVQFALGDVGQGAGNVVDVLLGVDVGPAAPAQPAHAVLRVGDAEGEFEGVQGVIPGGLKGVLEAVGIFGMDELLVVGQAGGHHFIGDAEDGASAFGPVDLAGGVVPIPGGDAGAFEGHLQALFALAQGFQGQGQGVGALLDALFQLVADGEQLGLGVFQALGLDLGTAQELPQPAQAQAKDQVEQDDLGVALQGEGRRDVDGVEQQQGQAAGGQPGDGPARDAPKAPGGQDGQDSQGGGGGFHHGVQERKGRRVGRKEDEDDHQLGDALFHALPPRGRDSRLIITALDFRI